MKIMRWALLLYLVGGIIGGLRAQDVPQPVVEAAIRAATTQRPELGRPNSWEWQLLPATSSSSLGCPLVSGTELGRSVTPYRIGLVYPDGIYVVFVAADAQLAQICDAKFGEVVAATPVVSGCTLAANGAPTLRLAPEANAAAITGTGFTNGQTFGIGRTQASDWYQVRLLEGGTAWVNGAEVTPGGDCSVLPITAAFDPNALRSICFVTPVSAFANVRQQPDTAAPQVDSIFENTTWQVMGRNTAGTWYYINPGWVALSVVQTNGFCDGLPVMDDAIGRGSAAAQATPLPQEFACPANFRGFMPPRLQLGRAGARVVADGPTPSNIRSEPTVNGTIIGQAQPGRTLDAVLDGPACTATFVWWRIELDGITGWAAESNAADQRYFLEPVTLATTPTPTPAANISGTPAQPTPAPVPALPTPAGLVQAEVLLPLTQDAGAADVLAAVISPAGGWLARLIDVDRSTLWLTDISDLTTDRENRDAMIELPSPALLLAAVAPDGVAVLSEDGQVRVYGFATRTEVRAWPLAVNTLPAVLRFSPDGRFALIANWLNDAPNAAQGQYELRDATSGQVLRIQPAHPARPDDVLFSPDGTRIVTSGADGVQLWDFQSGAFVTAFAQTNPNPTLSNVVYLENGAALARGHCALGDGSACQVGALTLWTIENGAVAELADAHQGAVLALAASADGARFASGGADGRVIVWDAATRTPITYVDTGAPVNALAFAPDGTFFFAEGTNDALYALAP